MCSENFEVLIEEEVFEKEDIQKLQAEVDKAITEICKKQSED